MKEKETQLSLSVVLRGVINSVKQWEYDDIKLAFPLALWLTLFSLSAHLPTDVRPPIQVFFFLYSLFFFLFLFWMSSLKRKANKRDVSCHSFHPFFLGPTSPHLGTKHLWGFFHL